MRGMGFALTVLMRALFLALICLGVCLSSTTFADEYFVMVSGYQDGPNTPRNSHTFATFVKVKTPWDGIEPPVVLETKTISWLPEGFARDLTLRYDDGKNYSLAETLSFADRMKRRGLSMSLCHYGAYPISPDVFEKAQKRIDYLNSGQVDYKMLDLFTRRRGAAINCIHAVTDLAGFYKTGFMRGCEASGAAVNIYQSRQLIKDRRSNERVKEAILEKAKRDSAAILSGAAVAGSSTHSK